MQILRKTVIQSINGWDSDDAANWDEHSDIESVEQQAIVLQPESILIQIPIIVIFNNETQNYTV